MGKLSDGDSRRTLIRGSALTFRRIGSFLASLDDRLKTSRLARYITLAIIGFAAITICWRIYRALAMHSELTALNWLTIIASIGISIYVAAAALRRDYVRSIGAMTLEACFTLFMFAQVDVPVVLTASKEVSRYLWTRPLAISEREAPDLKGRVSAAADLFKADDDPPYGGSHQAFYDHYASPGYNTLRPKECPRYQLQRRRSGSIHDALLDYSFARMDGFCSAAAGLTARAVKQYLLTGLQSPGNARVLASWYAVRDGYPAVGSLLLAPVVADIGSPAHAILLRERAMPMPVHSSPADRRWREFLRSIALRP